jgi:hypothetical protein
MLEAALTFGLIIFAGIALILWKLPVRTRYWLLGHHMWLDIFVTVLTLWIHWGTVTGLMSAAMAGMMCALATSATRYIVGYTHKGVYYPGILT